VVNECRWREDFGPSIPFFDSLVPGLGVLLAAAFAASVRTPVEEKIEAGTAAWTHVIRMRPTNYTVDRSGGVQIGYFALLAA
jgi:hypothetical protein